MNLPDCPFQLYLWREGKRMPHKSYVFLLECGHSFGANFPLDPETEFRHDPDSTTFCPKCERAEWVVFCAKSDEHLELVTQYPHILN